MRTPTGRGTTTFPLPTQEEIHETTKAGGAAAAAAAVRSSLSLPRQALFSTLLLNVNAEDPDANKENIAPPRY